MATAPKDIVSSVTPDLAALQSDVSALKKDVATLLDHLQKQTVTSVRGVADRIEKQAEDLYRTVYAKGEQQAEVLSNKIEDQPLTAVLIAAGIGYLGGRLLAR